MRSWFVATAALAATLHTAAADDTLAGFDHRRHQQALIRQRRAQATCAGCHPAGPPGHPPAPTKAQCATAGCHDGTSAFATTTACTRCHTRAPTETTVVARPSAPFRHDAHAARMPIDRCAMCHQPGARGEAVSTGHAACTSCHADDFARREPTTCGACHVATEPWRRLQVDQLPRSTSDFGVAMPHGQHAAIGCTTCHQLTTTQHELRPPRGHTACRGDGCHTNGRGSAPTFAECTACHVRGLERERQRRATQRPWSVQFRFRHTPHTRDPRRDAALACTTCHPPPATDSLPMSPPTKSTCVPCHDGSAAFKLTGHNCAACHDR